MIVKKGNVEITIRKEDYPKYKESGWSRKDERKPENSRKRYLKQKQKGSEQ